jgi:hypothetical protein
MNSHSQTKAQVVDLLQYRRERSQQRLDFSGEREPQPALALVKPFRTLTEREVAHRERMAAFLSRTAQS